MLRLGCCLPPLSKFLTTRLAVNQVTLLTQDIEDIFSAKKKAVFVDLTAAYDTVWHGGFTCKLLRLLLDRHTVHMIMEMVGNRSFTLTTGNDKRSRLRRLNNGVPQGSVLAPLLFNICISDLPITVSRKYAYADDLAIMQADADWQAVEGVLSKGMATIGEYLQTWKLKLNTTKTVSAAFHLNNKEAKRELKVNLNNETLPFCSEPKYLGATLDRSLTYRRHLESLRKKLASCVALLRRLAGSAWGDGATTLFCLSLIAFTSLYQREVRKLLREVPPTKPDGSILNPTQGRLCMNYCISCRLKWCDFPLC